MNLNDDIKVIRDEFEKQDKEMTRKMYNFNEGEAFDLFYKGLVEGYSGDAKKAAKIFEESVAKDPSVPATHMYLLMMYEFSHEPESKCQAECVEWAKVAELSGDIKQHERAMYSLEYYNATPEKRMEMIDDLKKTLKIKSKRAQRE
jgi:hypothetical protein